MLTSVLRPHAYAALPLKHADQLLVRTQLLGSGSFDSGRTQLRCAINSLRKLGSPTYGKSTRGERESLRARQLRNSVPGYAVRFGLSRLPAPSDGDIFFDLEGDPFVDDGGLEFLFGYAFKDATGTEAVTTDWALLRDDEKAAFERFVDFVIARLEVYPDLHVYHYAPYEPAALKRLMGRYVTREDEIDRMLRGGVFVDLYAVVRHAIRASVESYSIKKLEPLYDFQRTVGLPDAAAVLAKVQASLELGDIDGVGAEERTAVAGYNRDDCLSAWRLRDWLEKVRSELVAAGQAICRPAPQSGEAGEDLTAWQQKIAELIPRSTFALRFLVRARAAPQPAVSIRRRRRAAMGTVRREPIETAG